MATALPPLAGMVPALYPTGFTTILIAHIMFNISFVVVTVKARLSGFDRNLEEAAMDLGANELTTFWKITFPLILPGILAAALLAFSLSIDDFVITNFVSGTTNTFPIWIYGVIRNALPVQINVIGSMIFLGAVGLVGLSSLAVRVGRPASADRQGGPMVETERAAPTPPPSPTTPSCRRSGAGSRTSTSIAARARG